MLSEGELPPFKAAQGVQSTCFLTSESRNEIFKVASALRTSDHPDPGLRSILREMSKHIVR